MSNRLKSKAVLAVLVMIVIFANVEHGFTVSWSQYVHRLTTDLSEDSSPSITQMSRGDLWIIWGKNILGDAVLYYVNSSDCGISWSEKKNLTQLLAPGHNTHPSMIQAANGTVWIVWSSDRPPPPSPDFTMKASPQFLSIPKGGSDSSTITITSIDNFNDPVDLTVSSAPDNVTATLNPTQVTPPPNGAVSSTLTISVETTATPGIYIVTVKGVSGSLTHIMKVTLEITEPGTLSSTSALPCTPVEEHAEEEAEEDYEIFYKTSNDYGCSWSDDAKLTNNRVEDLNPSVIQAANGTVWVAWSSDKTGNDEIFYKTYDGASWSSDTQLPTDQEENQGPSIMQGKDGKIWVFWSSRRTGDYEIFYKTYDGASWSSDTRLTYSTNNDSSPSAFQALNGAIYVFWGSRGVSSSATGDIYYTCSHDNGASWSDSIQFTTDDNEDLWPSVTQANDCKIWVAWTSNRGDQPDGNWDIYYKASLAGDINEDGIVDIADLSIVTVAYGTFEGEPDYNPDADINKDGIVDIGDITIVSIYFGET